MHLDCHPWGVHLSDNTEDVGLDGVHASRDLHRFAYKIFAFSCAESTSKISPLSNATFVPFDNYMKHASYFAQFATRALTRFSCTFSPLNAQPGEAPYSILYSILIPLFSTSARNTSAGTSRSCNTPPLFEIAPEASICTTMDAGKAVVRIIALMSVFAS